MVKVSLIISAAAAATTALAASSSGCGQTAPFSSAHLTSQWIVSNDKNRTYLVNLPDAYDSKVAAPLILSYHGSARDAKYQATVDQFTKKSLNPNSIVVYPQGENVRFSTIIRSTVVLRDTPPPQTTTTIATTTTITLLQNQS